MVSDNSDEYATIVKEVFQNSKSKKAFGLEGCDKLLKLFQKTEGIKWDLAIFLASREIRVNDQTFLYPPMLQFMYMDNTDFTLNIEDGDDVDSLDIPFKTVKSIHLKESTSSKVVITLDLSSPPATATELASPKTNTSKVIFEINSEDLEEFRQTLTSRGLSGGHVNQGEFLKNVRVKNSVADQPLDLNNISISNVPLELKSIEVQQCMNTAFGFPTLPG
ncbi:hypothetical protein Clacol_006904 [Clathrus columnatus]|uniref:Uncharacterized protein n=1 Tax=Clathrus columnatus TaxID=1419009 RepID=A0AAV5AEG6_9AGAM|nr:hypothetical protein Clacol_006904 [Clathrus columnatus]